MVFAPIESQIATVEVSNYAILLSVKMEWSLAFYAKENDFHTKDFLGTLIHNENPLMVKNSILVHG